LNLSWPPLDADVDFINTDVTNDDNDDVFCSSNDPHSSTPGFDSGFETFLEFQPIPCTSQSGTGGNY
jgi:hypothetical protein